MSSTDHSRTAVTRARHELESLISDYRRSGRDRLPPEIELSGELGVSRNSLREALAQLESEGVLIRRRRVGTVIAPVDQAHTPPEAVLRYPIDEIVSIPAFFSGEQQPFQIDAVTVTQESADAETAATLEIDPGGDIYRVRRKFVIERGAAAIGEHVIPRVLDGHGIHIEALTDGVSTFLAEVEHIRVDVVEHVVNAIAADRRLADELGVPLGAPLLTVTATLNTGARAVAIGQLTFNPALVRVRATGRSQEG